MKVDYWDCREEAEYLRHESIDAAIESYVDELEGDIPETVIVYGWKKNEISGKNINDLADSVLEHALEWLDDDFGDPEEYTETTPGMVVIAKEFAEKLAQIYRVWSCEMVIQKEINLRDWMNPEITQV